MTVQPWYEITSARPGTETARAAERARLVAKASLRGIQLRLSDFQWVEGEGWYIFTGYGTPEPAEEWIVNN